MAQQAAPTSAVLSTQITAQDGAPFGRLTAGAGGAGLQATAAGTALISATLATTVAVRLVRIPTSALVKKVEIIIELNGATVTTLTGAIGLLWSDNSQDGTPAIDAGSLTPASSSCFAATLAMAGYTLTWHDVTFQNAAGNSATDGFYVPSASIMPIWLALSQGGPGPQTPNAWAGLGATSLSTAPLYQLSADPGGFFDVFFQPTTTTSMSAAVNMTCQVAYTAY